MIEEKDLSNSARSSSKGRKENKNRLLRIHFEFSIFLVVIKDFNLWGHEESDSTVVNLTEVRLSEYSTFFWILKDSGAVEKIVVTFYTTSINFF